ncbi:MAG: hypothetical protein KIT37_06805 [Steroidobacteraceae bacterium]|nr:hypothetical protein [Steroidobacteraceae bacterium]
MKITSLGILVAAGLIAGAAQADEPLKFDASRYSQQVTGCDLLAAHPDDPNKVAPGLKQSQIDLPAAIGACQAAVARDPQNPRLNYQLGRVYGYSGQGEKAAPYRDAALAADYPQALFVYGYLHLLGENKATRDVCLAGELLRRSALYGRIAGQIGFPFWSLKGEFAGCAVRQDYDEMLQFLSAADEQTGDFYQETAIELLQNAIKAKTARKKR